MGQTSAACDCATSHTAERFICTQERNDVDKKGKKQKQREKERERGREREADRERESGWTERGRFRVENTEGESVKESEGERKKREAGKQEQAPK